MPGAEDRRYDVAIVGASIAGCTAALAYLARGARVLLLEADPHAAQAHRVGVWLHPNAMEMLEGLGVDLTPPVGYPTGKGFVVHPEDGSAPIVLPYRAGTFGFSLPHGLLVETLRAHCRGRGGITLLAPARATRLIAGRLEWQERGLVHGAQVADVVCAGGADLELTQDAAGSVIFHERAQGATHRVASLELVGGHLPFEGYRHLFVGGPGPASAHRVGPTVIQLALDVPLGMRAPRDGGLTMLEAYRPALPPALAQPFTEALRRGAPSWCSGHIRPRGELVVGNVRRIGDAGGSLHPLMAAGATLAIGDAIACAETTSAERYRIARAGRTRVPEAVAIGLTELFTDPAPESLAIRRATYRLWRRDPGERLRSMGFIAGDHEGMMRFGVSCLRVMLSGAGSVAGRALRGDAPLRAHRVGVAMATRIGWMLGGSLGWTELLPDALADRLEARGTSGFASSRFGAAIHLEAGGEVVGLPTRATRDPSIQLALERGARALVSQQAEDGSFEGEVVWCAMLAAQYVLASYVMGRRIEPERRRLILRHFETTRLADGTWGLHEKSEGYLFVTTLVYVACRILGVEPADSLVASALAFIEREGGAVGIPSWGKLWLALVGLYGWDGVNPVVPELWTAPRWLPLHPSRYYCHTRLIYMGMATLYGARVTREPGALIRAVRGEIFNVAYDQVDFGRARETLRVGDMHDPPGPLLKWGYRALVRFDSTRTGRSREALLDELRDKIRYELRSTSYTCISPVSGLLGMLALHANDPADPDLQRGLEAFEGWIWEDEAEGARVCGARSATWDTSFAAQALEAVAPFVDVQDAQRQADTFLASQQMKSGTGLEAQYDRLDPTGGYCFAGVWHGWPVSDCTAEAMLARLESSITTPDPRAMREAAKFIMQCQNADGGFGSYEARRVDRLSIDWLNPSEMFGACMTERSYVECTASCTAALARFQEHFPYRMTERVRLAVERGVHRLRAAQEPDGSFEGMWGVHFIYGTMFGVRGLLAGGVPSIDPAIRRACAWLLERQRPDGSWGEHFGSVVEGRYVEHHEGQVVQTAWALTALLEAQEPDFAAIERGAEFIARTQQPDGTWAKQDPEGIFFHTALLEYRLYRAYFPPWALGLYARRAEARARFRGGKSKTQDLAG